MDEAVEKELSAFLEEDLGRGDVTSEALVAEDARAAATVRTGKAAVTAGLEEAIELARMVRLETRAAARDGERVEAGTAVLRVRGRARAILGVERTLLNLISHMSGVATLTRHAVDAVDTAFAGTRAQHPPRVAATRKTLPGLRRLQKKAVVLGGGVPHRRDLSAAVLVKDNHLALLDGVREVVPRVRKHIGDVPIEIEVESLDDALRAARSGAGSLLLDNIAPAGIVEIVDALRAAGLRDAVSLEASGGITLQTIGAYADTGVEVISLGMLTSSAPHVDYSLHFDD